MSRASLITMMHNHLGALATTAGLTDSEASYGDALTLALAAYVGYDTTTVPTDLNTMKFFEVFEQYALRKLLNFYTFYVDTTVGPRKQAYSQTLDSISKRITHPIVVLPNSTYLNDFNRYGSASWRWDYFQHSDFDNYEV